MDCPISCQVAQFEAIIPKIHHILTEVRNTCNTLPIAREYADEGGIGTDERKKQAVLEASFYSAVGIGVRGRINVARHFVPDSADRRNREDMKSGTMPHGFLVPADQAIPKGGKAVILENTGVFLKTLHTATVK